MPDRNPLPQSTKSAPFTVIGKIAEIDGKTGAYQLAEVHGRMGQTTLDGEGTFWVHANEKTQVFGKPRKGQRCLVHGRSRMYPGAGKDNADKWLSFPNVVVIGDDVFESIETNAASA